ncbi:MAG: co-chaperone YbbN [Magnetococcales bacterium]|nr:co-chaperone YbbN [Magnetococcales bacterium]
MSHSQWVIDVDEASFVKEVAERSHTTPVLVDFWAPWCGPCKTLGPILEKLAEESSGRFILAKINADENQQLGQQFGVRGIPAVKLVIDGKLAGEFTGAQPESQIKEFLDKHIPSPADDYASQAESLIQQGDLEGASTLYANILSQQPDHIPSLLGLTKILVEVGRMEEAQEMFDRLPEKERTSPEAKALKARLTFQGSATDLSDLESAIAKDPDDLAARLELARALVSREEYAASMDQFLEVIRRDRSFDDEAGRQGMLQVFDMLGPTHPLVMQYRSQLSALLFS